MGNVAFKNDSCGSKSGQSVPVGGPLNPGDQVEINGSIDLSPCIVGNSNAKLYTVTLAEQSGIYSYVVTVVAEGPHGAFSGWFNLFFTDRTGDRYALGIWKSEKLQHTVAYNSSDPGIVKIEWGS